MDQMISTLETALIECGYCGAKNFKSTCAEMSYKTCSRCLGSLKI